ncbi:MAG: acetate--CoA ligase family protein [Acidimicrobiia bacterium]|nr:acetate--CoA ligase family protein [Acidimicrobiia bacterium]
MITTVDLAAVVDALFAHHPGQQTLAEAAAQEITRAIGIAVPRMEVVTPPGVAPALPGDRVVVKASGPLHKSDAGGVRIVTNTPGEIDAAMRAIAASSGTHAYLIAEFVDHDPRDEIIAGVRWTDAFGPVVSIGPGGVDVESGPPPALVAPATADRIAATLRSAAPSLLTGRRGSPPAADPAALTSLIASLLAFGEATMPQHLTEFEMNPVVFTAKGPIALDARAVAGSGITPSARRARTDAITKQLHPDSIAVIGVSEQMNPGRVIVRNILAAGFPVDRVVVIKPDVAEIEGCRCVAGLDALEAPVDLLVVAVPASAVVEVMDQAIATGAAHSIVLIPGGVGERPGTEHAADRIRSALAASSQPPVITGPNSMGVRSEPGRYDATFIPKERMTSTTITPPITPPLWGSRRGEAASVGGHAPPIGEHPDRGVALIAQSGAFALARLDRLPWLEPRFLVTVGNQIDLTIGDYLEAMAADPSVDMAACYLEGFLPGDGDRALRAAREMRRRGGAVLWYRGGRTAAGVRSAATHTAAIATDDVVTRSLAAAAGVLEAGSLDDFDDLLRIGVALHGRFLGASRLAIVSNAGFECVAAADRIGSLTLAEYSSATRERIIGVLRGAGLDGVTGSDNPLDLTPMAGDATYAAAVEAVLDDPGVDVAVVGCLPFTPALRTMPEQVGWTGSLPDRLAALAGHPTPWIAVIDAGRQYDPIVDHLEAAGIAVLRHMDRAVRLLERWVGSPP